MSRKASIDCEKMAIDWTGSPIIGQIVDSLHVGTSYLQAVRHTMSRLTRKRGKKGYRVLLDGCSSMSRRSFINEVIDRHKYNREIAEAVRTGRLG